MNIFAILENDNAEEIWQKFVKMNPYKSMLDLAEEFKAYFVEKKATGNPFAQVYIDLANREIAKQKQSHVGFMAMLKAAGVI